MGWRAEQFADVLPFGFLVADGVMLTPQARFTRTVEVFPKDMLFRSVEEWNLANARFKGLCGYLGEGWTLWIDFDHFKTRHRENFTSDAAPAGARQFDESHSQAVEVFYTTRYLVSFVYTLSNKTDFIFKKSGGKLDADAKARADIDTELLKFIETTNDVLSLLKAAYEDAFFLNSGELLTYLHSTYSDRKPVTVPAIPAYLDYAMADRVLRSDKGCKIDDEFVLAAGVTNYPDETRAGMLSVLLTAPCDFRFSTRFTMYSKEISKKKIDEARTQHYMKRKGGGAMLGEAIFKEESPLLDTEALAMVEEADEAMAGLMKMGTLYGTVTQVLVVRDKSYKHGREVLDYLRSLLRDKGFVVTNEDLNVTQAFLGTIPGNVEYNSRKYVVSTSNLIHFFPQSQNWRGTRVNSHLKETFGYEAPHMVLRSGRELFYYNKNVGDVGHGLILGPSGAGKSVWLNVEVTQWLAHYAKAKAIVFDVDKTAKQNCINNEGLFFDLGAEQSDFLLNPFWGLGKGEKFTTYNNNVALLFEMHFEAEGMRMDATIRTAIKDSVNQVAELPPEKRSFATFGSFLNSHAKVFVDYLDPFVKGDYKKLFSNGDDSIKDNRFLLFEMRKLMDMGDSITRFVFQYLFFKIETLFDKSAPYLVQIDEGWKLLQHPAFAAKFSDWLRTLRKAHVYVTLATQQIGELQAGNFETIANQCQTVIFLPNPRAQKFADLYRSLNLEDDDIYELSQAQMKRDYLYSSPNGKQLVSLALDEPQLAAIQKPLEEVNA